MTTSALRAKAFKIRDYLMEGTEDSIVKENLMKFKASDCFLQGLMRRHCVQVKSIKGTEDSLCPQKIAVGRLNVKCALSNYSSANIFNADETGLLYRALPGTALGYKGTSTKEITVAKDRVSVLLCCSAIGEKLTPLVVGRYERPRALKDCPLGTLQCLYFWNKSSWVTRAIFEAWLTLINNEMEQSQRHICLIIDNFSGHVVRREFSHIKIVFLMPGLTSVLQPLDSGIIHSFKAHYRNLLVNLYLGHMENTNIKKIDLKKTIKFISDAWLQTSEQTIINCWRHADVIEHCTLLELADAAMTAII